MSIYEGEPKFDLRTLNRALREGKITQKEADQYLKNLPDEAANAQEITLDKAEKSRVGGKKEKAQKTGGLTFIASEG